MRGLRILNENGHFNLGQCLLCETSPTQGGLNNTNGHVNWEAFRQAQLCMRERCGRGSVSVHCTLSRCVCTKQDGHGVHCTHCLLADGARAGCPAWEQRWPA